jgi:nitronate monooxygenase
MRQAGLAANDVQRIAAWAGQSAALARPEPAGDFVRHIWQETQALSFAKSDFRASPNSLSLRR